MRTDAHNQNPAPRLNAQTLYGSNPVKLVSRAPIMVNAVPSHFSVFSVSVIIVVLYGQWAKLSTDLAVDS